MPNYDVFSLNVMNFVFGAFVVVALLFLVCGLICEFVSRHKNHRGLRNGTQDFARRVAVILEPPASAPEGELSFSR